MDRGIYISATGGLAQARWLDATTNNLANVSTPAAKKDLPVFKVYTERPGATSSGGLSSVSSGNVYVQNSETYIDFSQGPVKGTNNPFDVALSGEGFMKVDTDDGPRYTRKGDFTADSEGRLTTKNGHVVQGVSGVINLTTSGFSIDETGTVSENGIEVGKIKIVMVDNPQSLMKVGSGLYAPKDGSVGEIPADETKVLHKHLEMSNASAVKEMVSMINALRAYESNMKLIQGYDSMTEKAIGIGAK